MIEGQSKSWSWRHAVLGSGLPATTRHVLLTISCYMNELGQGCYPTTLQLAAATGLSQRAVCEHIAKAVAAGWLSVSAHGLAGQKWRNNQYEARWPSVEVLTDDQQLMGEGADAGSAASEKGADGRSVKVLTVDQSNIPITPPLREGARAKEDALSIFRIAFRMWPTAISDSRRKAWSIFRKLSPDQQRTAVTEIRRYVDAVKAIGRSKLCGFDVYLAERRWEGLPPQPVRRPPGAPTRSVPQQRKPTKFMLDNKHLYPEVFGTGTPLP